MGEVPLYLICRDSPAGVPRVQENVTQETWPDSTPAFFSFKKKAPTGFSLEQTRAIVSRLSIPYQFFSDASHAAGAIVSGTTGNYLNHLKQL